MGIDEIRIQQRERQKQQIERRGEELYRIGDRRADGNTELIYPDDSRAVRGVKLFGATHQSGDPVLAQRRSDGAWLLSGPTPPDRRQPISIYKDARGYRDGKVFDNPVKEAKKSGLLLIQVFWQTNPIPVRLEAVLQVGAETLDVTHPVDLVAYLPANPEKPAITLENSYEDSEPRQQAVLIDLGVVSEAGEADISVALGLYWLGLVNDPIGPNPVTVRVSLLGAQEGFTVPEDGIVLDANQTTEYEIELTVVGGILGALTPQPSGTINYSYRANRLEIVF